MKVNRNSAQLSFAQIAAFYRRAILTGSLPPGTRLPSNRILAKNWSTSTAAVQQALSTLAAEGLLERKQRSGTFVRDASERAYIGILVGPNLIHESATFYRYLCAILQAKLEKSHLSTRVYDNLTFGKPSEDRGSLKNLSVDVKNYHFKGFLFLGTSKIPNKKLPDLKSPGVYFQDLLRGLDVNYDARHFAIESLRQLVQRGFRRFAHFRTLVPVPSLLAQTEMPGIGDAVRELSLPPLQNWDIMVSGETDSFEDEVHEIVTRKFRQKPSMLKKEALPEVILVHDDVSARPLIFNLLKHGVRVPEDVEVCVQTNHGIKHYYGVPVFRYEFSTKALAEAMVQILNKRMTNRQDAALPILVQGVFIDYKSSRPSLSANLPLQAKATGC
jgi:DNA-binding transcriptional regulator YhcF (GntR family)